MALRTSLVAQPHLYMGDTQGRPLDAGKVYFGEPNKDPELYPIDVYYDEALTIAAPQPIRTMGGFMNANGQMIEVYAAETTYSVKVLDGYGRQVFYQASMTSENAELQAVKFDTGITVTAKNGGIERLLSEKDAEKVSPKDYGAVGDNATNDTDAFNLLEANNSKKKIDLLGLSYVVDNDFVGNQYYNGSFVINGLRVVKDDGVEYTSSIATLKTDKKLGVLGYPKMLGDPANISPDGVHTFRSFQSFAIDNRNRHLYTLHQNGASLGNLSFVNRYDLDGDLVTPLDYSKVGSSEVGHQGLAIDTITDNGGVRLWTTSENDSRCAVRYKYNAGVGLEEVEEFRFFGTDFTPSLSCTPEISYDSRYLVAQGQIKGRSNVNTIRVFDFKRMVEKGAGDHSNDWLYEFETDIVAPTTHPVQGIACDSKSIWIVAGDGGINTPKRLYEYSIKGVLVNRDDSFAVGKGAASSTGTGTLYEPEGLSLYRNGATGGFILCVGIIMGDHHLGRVSSIYGLGMGDLIKAGGGVQVPHFKRGNVHSGTYTPTVVADTNVESVSAFKTQYNRVGDTVTVSGRVDITASTLGNTEVRMSLPIPSNFDYTYRAGGTCSSDSTTGSAYGCIRSDAATNTALFRLQSTTTSKASYFFSFTYLIM